MRPPTCPRIARLNQEALEEILRIKSIFCPVPPAPTVVFTYRSFPHRPFPTPVPVPVIVPYDPPYTPPFTYCSTTKKTVFPSNVKSTFYTTLPSSPFPKTPFKQKGLFVCFILDIAKAIAYLIGAICSVMFLMGIIATIITIAN